ncbi:Alpha-ketoglutarate-dependent taurine dioxygenase like protein [Verticillium longisporum]|uniref:Alpha-ketoglutarate-dependent taurine dioxygenase like protein n=1 Tax=Verticillium longisporum TaxID=100787 RepID=A0A8I2ZWB2_VERLO|nr:Alpha-ketoglutarate-dependent taurine dioxygenase like protein [Verticillium longisporum]
MAPSATETAPAKNEVDDIQVKKLAISEKPAAPALEQTEELLPELRTDHREPLKLSGALDKYEHIEVTPVIGREYVNVNLAELLKAPNSDDLILSQRGVLFFRKQDDVTNDLQKELVQRLGELSGKPSTSKLHIHPINNAGRGDDKDDEISVISSEQAKRLYLHRFLNYNKKQSQKSQWHSDITFEPIPSDYALLRLTQLPETGGDTLWASGYEPGFNEAADKNGFKIYSAERGAPENVGELLEAIHPVIRTNPVTGWKSVFAVGHHVQKINGLSDEESKHFLAWFVQLIVENHDLQVRFKWKDVNDVAIWDNRSVYHAATPDYLFENLGERQGSRAVSLGERPYFDPQSSSRREAIKAEMLAAAGQEKAEQ